MTTAKQLISKAAACIACGKEHRPLGGTATRAASWAAPDGHPYRSRIGMMLNTSGPPVVAALRQLEAE